MKLPSGQITLISNFLVFLCLVTLTGGATNCGDYARVSECVNKNNCEFYTAKACNGFSVSICAPKKECQIAATCAQDNSSKLFYIFPTNCLPVGFTATVSSKCICPPHAPPAPPGVSYCAILATAADCKLNSQNCDLLTGRGCGNQQYSFCRAKSACPAEQRCAEEPATGKFYLFQRACLPDGWVRAYLSNCTCSGAPGQ